MNKRRKSRAARAKGIYLLPNLFTTSGLFAGFYAIVAGMEGFFDYAAIAIFIAMVADSLDGRIARMTHTSSVFGGEYDSLSDSVAFGLAPALVAYSFALYGLGKIGWLAAFLYVAGTSLRLAKFNAKLNAGEGDKRYFFGIPCTAAAGFMAGLIWVLNKYQVHGEYLGIIIAFSAAMLGSFQVSNIKYRSFKDSDFKGNVPFFLIPIVILLFVGIALDPPDVLFGMFFIYVFSGPVGALLGLFRKKTVVVALPESQGQDNIEEQ